MKTVRAVALVTLFLSAVAVTSPVLAQYYGRRYTPAPEEEPHVRYMGERCRSLYNALRSRSVSSREVMEGVRREYQRDCEDEAADARQRYYDERNDARRAKHDDWRDARKQAHEQYKEQRADTLAQRRKEEDERRNATQQSAQCAEAYRILANKKARADLSEGEKSDLRRFEDNINARCRR